MACVKTAQMQTCDCPLSGAKEECLVIIMGDFFLGLHKNIIMLCILNRQGASNEYPQHMFL